MVCYCLDLRPGSKVGKFLSNKIVALIAAIVQLILWVIALFNFIIQPGSMKVLVQELSTAALAISIIIVLLCIAFSVLLLIGLLRDRGGYIKSYLIFIGLLIAIFIISFFYNLFTQPGHFGFSGFFSNLVGILLNVLYFFIIRNYYLALISPKESSTGPA